MIKKMAVLRKLKLCIAAILIFSCTACFLKTETPIQTIHYQTGAAQSENLIIFLPGRFSKYTDYDAKGFINAIKVSGISADAVAVDAHLGYYVKRILLDRLLEDVVKPAREKGYRRIWIVGASMGGTGAALYAQKYHDTVEGVFLIAPFLGDREVIDEINGAGGVRLWVPVKPYKKKDYQRPLWEWFQVVVKDQESYPVICCGYGTGDKYVDHIAAVTILAKELPGGRIYTAPGGHDWEPWLVLFNSFLKSGVFPGE